jgi:hypothetical protein
LQKIKDINYVVNEVAVIGDPTIKSYIDSNEKQIIVVLSSITELEGLVSALN